MPGTAAGAPPSRSRTRSRHTDIIQSHNVMHNPHGYLYEGWMPQFPTSKSNDYVNWNILLKKYSIHNNFEPGGCVWDRAKVDGNQAVGRVESDENGFAGWRLQQRRIPPPHFGRSMNFSLVFISIFGYVKNYCFFQITHSIFLTADVCPRSVRYLCGCLQRAVIAKWPNERFVRTRVVSG